MEVTSGNPFDSIPIDSGSTKKAPEEDLCTFMGFDRTKEMQSGGLFILSSQKECQQASNATRIGHTVLGAVKVAAAVAFVASGAWLAGQIFTGMTALPALCVGCGLAVMFRSPEPIVLAGIYAGSPTILVGVLLKSAYHDFKLSVTGKA